MPRGERARPNGRKSTTPKRVRRRVIAGGRCKAGWVDSSDGVLYFSVVWLSLGRTGLPRRRKPTAGCCDRRAVLVVLLADDDHCPSIIAAEAHPRCRSVYQ